MRRRLRWLPLALLATAVLEVVVFLLVGRLVGVGPAVLLVVAASVAGMFLLRREGLRAWRGFQAATRDGRPPGGQVTDGLVGLAAGLLLALPGLVSGLLGLLLVVPPVRRLARYRVQTATERRVSSMVAGDLFGPRRVRVRPGRPQSPSPSESAPGAGGPAPSGGAIEGEIVDRR